MKNHMTQNGFLVQVLRGNDTTTIQDTRIIALCQVSSCIHRNIFIPKERSFNNLSFHIIILKAYRIKHASSHHAFFCVLDYKSNANASFQVKGLS